MAKRKISKKTNKPINIYDWAGMLDKSGEAFDEAFSKDNAFNSVSGIAGAATSILGAAQDNAKIADTSQIEGNINNAKNYVVSASDNESLMNEWSAWSPMDNIGWKDIRGGSTGQRLTNTIGALGSGVSTGVKVGGPIGGIIGGVAGLGSAVAGWISGGAKAKRQARKLNNEIADANEHNLLSLENKASAIDTQNDLLMMANFANNGGFIQHQHGGIFDNGITIIENGGTHDENPNDGVQIGVDPQGIPNLVEEGEVIWNDYVFSNRLKPTQEFKDKYKVKGETFADVAKNIQKESEERPNDSISKKGLEDSMMKLMMEQENMRSKKVKNNNKNIYATGGPEGMDPYLLEDNDNLFISPTGSKLLSNPYSDASISYSKPESGLSEDFDDSNNKLSILRYAPVVGSALGVLENMFSKPNYSNARMIEDAANKAGTYIPISYTPIGNYLDYKPLDKGYHLNKLNAQAGATRRAIINQSAGNRATAMAGLLTADYNAQGKYGDLIRQAEEINRTERARVQEFNRATNMANTQMALQAASTNQRAQQVANEMRLKGIAQAASVRDKIDASRVSARNANLTNLFDNLSAVGKERTMIDMLNNNPALLYEVMSGKYKGNTSACGGYLTIKNKRRK